MRYLYLLFTLGKVILPYSKSFSDLIERDWERTKVSLQRKQSYRKLEFPANREMKKKRLIPMLCTRIHTLVTFQIEFSTCKDSGSAVKKR